MSAALTGVTQVLNRFLTIQASLKDLEPAMKASGVYMLGSIERNFTAQGRPQKWAGLAASTLAARRRGKGTGGAKILIDEGLMKGSVTTGDAMQTSSESMVIGTNKIQAARQHFGYPGGKGRGHAKTPARPFLLFQAEDADAIETIFNRHLNLT
jgi:phage virion morphogenesis protein